MFRRQDGAPKLKKSRDSDNAELERSDLSTYRLALAVVINLCTKFGKLTQNLQNREVWVVHNHSG